MGLKLQYFAIIFFVFMINSYYTFAFWDGPPDEEPPTEKLQCVEWLAYYKFTEDNTEYNRSGALSRSRKNDTDVVETAALYAQHLCSFPKIKKFLPSDYCKKYSTTPKRFQKLTDLTRRCKDWLKLYGFEDEIDEDDNGNYLNPDVLHWHRSKNRNKSEDQYINIWPALFVRFLDDVPVDKSMEAKDFCLKMGQKSTMETWTYMTLDTQMSCKDWIKFGGYSNSFQENIEVAYQNSGFDQYTNTWAHRYGNHIRVDSAGVPLPRKMPGYRDPKYYEYIYDNTAWLTPNQFCIKNEKKKTSRGDVMYSYFNDN